MKPPNRFLTFRCGELTITTRLTAYEYVHKPPPYRPRPVLIDAERLKHIPPERLARIYAGMKPGRREDADPRPQTIHGWKVDWNVRRGRQEIARSGGSRESPAEAALLDESGFGHDVFEAGAIERNLTTGEGDIWLFEPVALARSVWIGVVDEALLEIDEADRLPAGSYALTAYGRRAERLARAEGSSISYVVKERDSFRQVFSYRFLASAS